MTTSPPSQYLITTRNLSTSVCLLYNSVHHVRDCAKVVMDDHATKPNGMKV